VLHCGALSRPSLRLPIAAAKNYYSRLVPPPTARRRWRPELTRTARQKRPEGTPRYRAGTGGARTCLPHAHAPWCNDGNRKASRSPWLRGYRLEGTRRTTKRTPINRSNKQRFTPEALAMFRQMHALPPCACNEEECRTCEKWWDLHSALHDALKAKPWNWPCVDDPEYPRTSEADKWALWQELAAMR
jgi:hypothetical protein